MTITAVIPAYNEAERIKKVISETSPFVDEILVIDDGSNDETALLSQEVGATVVSQPHQGYVQAVKCGFQSAKGDIVVTLDADGEHDPSDIVKVVAPIQNGKADLVLGRRNYVPSASERFIGTIVKVKAAVYDHGTGFRALTKELAVTLTLRGKCTCGTFVLEAVSKGARITEVPITIRKIEKKRKRKWIHAIQMVYVLYQFVKS